MHLVTGDMWEEIGKARLILFTANASINSRGELVMGRGAAAEAKARYPDLPRQIGRDLLEEYEDHRPYHVWLPPEFGESAPSVTHVGAFQVKHRWQDAASLTLIRQSAQYLAELIRGTPWRVAMNFPGIGYGRLRRKDVLPLLEALPDGVFVYEC